MRACAHQVGADVLRTRTRSLATSCAADGTVTTVISPRRSSRARGRRSDPHSGRAMHREGAATTHRIPAQTGRRPLGPDLDPPPAARAAAGQDPVRTTAPARLPQRARHHRACVPPGRRKYAQLHRDLRMLALPPRTQPLDGNPRQLASEVTAQ